MLRLKRVVYDYEYRNCDISGEIIGYGDFYYEDDEDGLVVKARVYHELKEREARERFDYSKLINAECQREYRELLKQAEKQLKTDTLLDRTVLKGDYRP